MIPTPTLEPPFAALKRLEPLIRQHADASETAATLARPVIDAIIDAGLLRQLTPASLGGGEIDPVEWYRVVEAAARIDGSLGWCVLINGATGTFGRAMPEAAAAALFGHPRTVIAGTIFPLGRAVALDDGYGVSGRWSFTSGCKHATHIGAACLVTDDAGDTGVPHIRVVFAPASEVQIIDNWDVVGLRGTGSHDIVFDNVFVPDVHTIPLAPASPNRHYTGPLYRLPFMSLIIWPIGAAALGIAQHAIDIVGDLSREKVPLGIATTPLSQRPIFHLQLADAVAMVRSARAWLHESIAELRSITEAGEKAGLQSRINAQLAASNATRSSREAVDLMFLAAGGTAVYKKNELQRCMRDIHALSQHAATNPGTWETAGTVLAGNPTPNPMLLL